MLLVSSLSKFCKVKSIVSMGIDKRGKVKGYGLGIAPSKVYGLNYNRERNNNNLTVEERLASLEVRVANVEAQIQHQMVHMQVQFQQEMAATRAQFQEQITALQVEQQRLAVTMRTLESQIAAIQALRNLGDPH